MADLYDFQAEHFPVVDHFLSRHPQIKAAAEKAKASGVPWLQIVATILPFIAGILQGKPLDIAALIAAIQALIPAGK